MSYNPIAWFIGGLYFLDVVGLLRPIIVGLLMIGMLIAGVYIGVNL